MYLNFSDATCTPCAVTTYEVATPCISGKSQRLHSIGRPCTGDIR